MFSITPTYLIYVGHLYFIADARDTISIKDGAEVADFSVTFKAYPPPQNQQVCFLRFFRLQFLIQI